MTEKRYATQEEAEAEAEALNAETDESIVYQAAFVNNLGGENYWIVDFYRNDR